MKNHMMIAAVAAALLAGPALANNGNGNGNGHGNAHAAAGCPPGLAKKDPACVPPGQAMKGVDAVDWRHRHEIGEVLPEANFYWLDPDNYDLPRLPDGQAYVVADDVVFAIDRQTYEVMQLINLLANLG